MTRITTDDPDLQAMHILARAHEQAMALLDDAGRKRVTDWYFDRFIHVPGPPPKASWDGGDPVPVPTRPAVPDGITPRADSLGRPS